MRFFTDSPIIDNLSETLDLNRSNGKDRQEFAFRKALKSSDTIRPGPYLGIVLRVEPTLNKENPPLGSWWSNIYGPGSKTGAPLPETLVGYKVRVDYLDSCLPDPRCVVQSIDEKSEAQKYIELHQTFWAPEGTQANVGDECEVDFANFRTREGPRFIKGIFKNGSIVSPCPDSSRPSAAYDKCADVDFAGAPDGSSLETSEKKYEDGIMNWVIGLFAKDEDEQVDSNEPKNTYPRECSIRTATGLANEPDTPEEEENLEFLEKEVIPRLLPELRKIDSRFVVTSVYRSDEVNARVGGSVNKKGEPTSYHTKGLAVDFGGLKSLSKTDRDSIMITAAKHLRNNKSKFPFLRKVIVELWRNHIHISVYPQKSNERSTNWIVQGPGGSSRNLT